MSSPDPPRPPTPPRNASPSLFPTRAIRDEALAAIRARIPGHSSSCACSRCTNSRNTRPGRPETGSTNTATRRSRHPARPTAATGPPDYTFPPLEPSRAESALEPLRRHRRHLASTMLVASSHSSTEPSTNPYQRPVPPPYDPQDYLARDNPFLPYAQANPNQRSAPRPYVTQNNPFTQTQRLQDQLTRAEMTVPQTGIETTPPTNDQAQDRDRNPFSQPWTAIPTPEEMRAAQRRHHDAMLSDADHARWGTGSRRPPRGPAADQALSSTLTRRPESSVISGVTPGRAEPSRRHRRSPHPLQDLPYGQEDDNDDESPDSLDSLLLGYRNSRRSSDQRPNSQPPLDRDHETPDGQTPRRLQDYRRSSDQRPSRRPRLDLGRPDEATVVRRRHENTPAALRQQAGNDRPTTGSAANSRSTREMYELVRRVASAQGYGIPEEMHNLLLGIRQNRRRLPANYVSTLPRVPVSSLSDNEYDRRCDICWEEYEHLVDGEMVVREEPVRLTCGHILGHTCATEYFTVPHTSDKPSTVCPTCRQEPVLSPSAPAPVQARATPAPNSGGHMPPAPPPIIPGAAIARAVQAAEQLTRAQTSLRLPQPASEATTAVAPPQPARSRAMSQELADYMAWAQQQEAGNLTLAQHEAHAVQNARVVGPPPRGGRSFAEYENWIRTETARREGWRLNTYGQVTGYVDGRADADDEDDDVYDGDDHEVEYDHGEEAGDDGDGDELEK